MLPPSIYTTFLAFPSLFREGFFSLDKHIILCYILIAVHNVYCKICILYNLVSGKLRKSSRVPFPATGKEKNMIKSEVLREKMIDFLTRNSPFSREQISSLPDDTLIECFIDILDHIKVNNGGSN